MKLMLSKRLYMLTIFSVLIVVIQNITLSSQELGGYSFPVWSPDGNYIAFASITGDLEYEIFLMQEDMTIRSLTNKVDEGIVLDIQWSPDGSYLAYTVGTGNNVDIWVSSIFEGQPYNLTLDIDGQSRNPAWSHDNNKIVFTNRENTGSPTYLQLSQIWIIDIDTMDSIQLTDEGSCYTDPQWLLDDRAITFILCSGEEGLYQFNFDNNEIVPIRYGQMQTYAISPVEEYIALASLQTNSIALTNLMVVESESTEFLALGFLQVFDLSWSPDEEWLTFSTLCDDGSKIFILNVQNRNLSDVTICGNGVFSSNPSWSPNRSSIIYQSNGDIWLYDLPTEEHLNLTEEL